MKEVNLRDFYPQLYKKDYIVEVPDEVMEVLLDAERKEASYQRKRYRYKAHYSLDREDGIEHDGLYHVLTPQEILEQREDLERLGQAIASLPDKQAKRIIAYYLGGKTMKEIALTEGVALSRISESIQRGIFNLAQILKR